MFKNSPANGIFVTKKIAAILNRKMKAAGYPSKVNHLKGYYGMNIVERFGGAVTEDCNEVANLIVEAYDEANPQEAYEQRMNEKLNRGL